LPERHQEKAGEKVKPVASILLLYTGFVAGSLQAMAFPDRMEGIGVILLVTIALIIVGIAHVRSKRKVKPNKTMPKRSEKKRSAVKSKIRVAKS
jgi:hypothetical protein